MISQDTLMLAAFLFFVVGIIHAIVDTVWMVKSMGEDE